MAGGLFVLPKMHKITQNSLLKKHGIFCLTFSKSCESIIFLLFLTECAIMVNNAVSVVIGLGSMAI